MASSIAGKVVTGNGWPGQYPLRGVSPVIAAIDELKKRLDALRPLPPDKVAAMASVFHARETEYIYESNAMEGNTLTLAETELVLSRGLTVSGKPLKDHLEATNHREALTRMQQMVQQKIPLSETSLLELHAMILRGIHDAYAGRYRDVPVRIAGSRHIPPNPHKVPALMEDLFQGFSTQAEQLHPVHGAADLHWRISRIHPFIDGNGRACRLMMNLHLLANGYPLTVIRSEQNQRVDYYHALAASDQADSPDPLHHFIAARVHESLTSYLQIMEQV